MNKYQKRISGPLLDRIDIHIEIPTVGYKKISSGSPARESLLFCTSQPGLPCADNRLRAVCDLQFGEDA